MTDTERLDKVERYVRDELDLSLCEMKRAKKLRDKEREDIWERRYDVLYGVLLRIID